MLRKLISAISLVLLVLVGLSGCENPIENSVESNIQFERAKIDVGDVWPGENKKVEVQLSNNSSERVFLVDDVTTSCACSVLERDFVDIPPGGVVTFPVQVSFGGTAGRFVTSIAVSGRFDDKEDFTIIKALIEGDIVDLVSLDRRAVDFGILTPRSGKFEEVIHIAEGELRGAISSIDVEGLERYPWIQTQYSRSQDGVWKVSFEIDSSHSDFSTQSQKVGLNFLDDSGLKGRREIFFRVRRVSDLTIDPGTLFCWDLDESGKVNMEFTVKSSDVMIPEELTLTPNGGLKIESAEKLVLSDHSIGVKGILSGAAKEGLVGQILVSQAGKEGSGVSLPIVVIGSE